MFDNTTPIDPQWAWQRYRPDADSPWDVKGHTPKVEAALPPGYKLDSKGKIQRKV